MNQLRGVSCAGGTCYAADYTISGKSTRPLIEAWNGKKWVREPLPASAAGALAAISCARGTSASTKGNRCLAAGNTDLAGSGASWRVVGKSGSKLGSAQLDSVSCPAAGACVLVGETTKKPVYATWNGKTFKNGVLHAPPHSFQSVTVAGVSCVSSGSCVAVGDYHSAQLNGVSGPSRQACVAVGISGNSDSFAEVYASGKWHLSATVNPV